MKSDYYLIEEDGGKIRVITWGFRDRELFLKLENGGSIFFPEDVEIENLGWTMRRL